MVFLFLRGHSLRAEKVGTVAPHLDLLSVPNGGCFLLGFRPCPLQSCLLAVHSHLPTPKIQLIPCLSQQLRGLGLNQASS